MGGVSCVKYLIFVFNLIFAITGLAILTVGAYIQSAYHHYANFVGESFWTAAILFMVVGSVIFIISFLGCCGAVKENSCMVLSFSILLVFIFIIEISVGIAAYIKHDQLEVILDNGFNTTLKNYETNVDAWKLIQTEMTCCGINGPEDWKTKFLNGTIPKACCQKLPVQQDECTIQWAYDMGCKPKLLHFFESNTYLLAGVGLAVAFVQLLGVCYACCLYRAFKRNYETV